MTSTLRFGPAWLVLMIAAAGTSTASAQIAASAASTAQGPSTPPPSTTPSPQSTSIPEHDTAPCDRYGVSTVVRCIGHDLGGMFHGGSLRSLAIGGALAAGAHLADDHVARALASTDPDRAVDFGTHIGEAGYQFALPAAMYVIARASGHQDTSDVAIMLFRAQVVNGIFTRGLKLFPRARPYQEDASVGQGSFPSGHASASFATATVFQRKWGWRAGVPAYAVATFISVTRLQNMHFLSDVTFGAALGIASGLAINVPGPHLALAPIVGRNVVGVSVTLGGPAS
jgi:membrane-associated phospholipid phosphatase